MTADGSADSKEGPDRGQHRSHGRRSPTQAHGKADIAQPQTGKSQARKSAEQRPPMASDTVKILNSEEIASLSLDRDLRVRFFTPAAGTRLGIGPADIGRRLADLSLNSADPALLDDARSVLARPAPIRREVKTADGPWLRRTVVPYCDENGRAEGVLATFTDVTGMKAAEDETLRAKLNAESVIDAIGEPLVMLDENMNILFANRPFYRFLDVSPGKAVGHRLDGVGARQPDHPALAGFVETIKAGNGNVDAYPMELDLNHRGRRQLVLSTREINPRREAKRRILVAIEDVTEAVEARRETELARQRAEQASFAKTRFLAAASHDLRQPLQTLRLLRAVLEDKVTDPEAKQLLVQCAQALRIFSDMLDSILDVNRLDAGAIQPQIVAFPIDELCARLREDLAVQVAASGLEWHVVRSGAVVRSDPRLLERMLRNLLSNAIKYTPRGKILLGCRRRGAVLSIQVWDTGPGIPESERQAIFQEFHQGTASAQAAGARGLGLGLSIVQRLAERLGHRVDLVSRVGSGSMFSIEVPLAPRAERPGEGDPTPVIPSGHAGQPGTIAIIENDPGVREALGIFAAARGLKPLMAATGDEALRLLAGHPAPPDLIIADYSLSGNWDGLGAIAHLRAVAGRDIPALVLTGDVSARTLRKIEESGLPHLTKPIHADQLWQALQQLAGWPASASVAAVHPAAAPPARAEADGPTIFVVDDDPLVRQAMRTFLEARYYRVEDFVSGESFLDALPPDATGCALVDFRLPAMDGIEVLRRLAERDVALPAIIITGSSEITDAVTAMKAGAMDFVEKPVDPEELAAAITRALKRTSHPEAHADDSAAAAREIARLTARQREILDLVVSGLANKEIAARLNINQRTVESHRALVMRKLQARSLASLVRLALVARQRGGLTPERPGDSKPASRRENATSARD
jgi:two-component system CheB/CheR fusion protein